MPHFFDSYIYQNYFEMLSPFKLLPFLEAGCDEAGRGCLAGPVTCASVLLPEFSSRFVDADSGMGFLTTNLDDSKQLSEKKRELLRPIIENTCVSFAVCHIFPNEIDNINILQASILGMQKAALKLCPLPKLILVDGNQFNNGKYLPKGKNNIFRIFNQAEFDIMSSSEVKKKHIFYETIIKGDAKYQSVAAASVLAKSYRDDYMNKIDKEFPMYNWKQNKGYPTKEHREAIAKHGLTKYHRKTFKCSI